MGLKIVILAAGAGSRMVADLPKVLHPLGGIPLLGHVIHTALSLEPEDIYVIYSNERSNVKEALLHEPVTWIVQDKPLGTGHAVMQALPQVNDDDTVLVLYGDVPLITKGTLQYLLNSTPQNGIGLLVAKVADPSGLGRIVRGEQKQILRIVEHKDASESELRLKEINTGIMAMQGALLKAWLPNLTDTNQQNEYYLTDTVALAVSEDHPVTGVPAFSAHEIQGVNNRWQLGQLERYYQQLQAKRFSLSGVTIRDFARFDVRGRDVTMDPDVEIDVNVILSGRVHIASGAYVGPGCCLTNVRVGSHVRIEAHSVISDTVLEANAHVGPFAHVHGESHVASHAEVGNFVELKNAKLGEGTKAKHLAYLGDATLGKQVNVGAGAITCNYDGKQKWETRVHDNVFIGSNTSLVAPITLHEGAVVGAGSTVSNDVEAKALAVTRAKLRTVKDWKK